MVAPLPTVIGGELDSGRERGKLLALEDMWEVALVSRNHSVACGPDGGTPAVARAASSA
jgi:hypothetical protein